MEKEGVRINDNTEDVENISKENLLVKAKAQKKRLDLSSLDGLRGILACWVMLHHCCIYNRSFFIDLQGSSLMPMFFLLTGYQCAIAYRDINPGKDEPECKSTFTGFYRGRIARVLPVYIFANLWILPLEYLGYLAINPIDTVLWILTYFTTFTLTSTMFIIFLGFPFDVVTWTIQTFFWYTIIRHIFTI
jgi:peptidoglycan/LPS O-acetylase OafA/YrhL